MIFLRALRIPVHMSCKILLFALAVLLLLGELTAQEPTPRKVKVRNVELTYIQQGTGEPLILLHGGQADYRSWLPHLPAFSTKFRTIAYSRRYNYPNDNPIAPGGHSAFVEADDLAAFLKKLGLKRVHLVGSSVGAYAALIVAVRHPKMVATLALAEPNIHGWVKDSPYFEEFTSKAWLPAARSFREGDDKAAMRYLIDIFGGPGTFDRMPPAALEVAMQNSKFFKAATLSDDHSPDISREEVKGLKMPVLLINGENTFPMFKLIIDEFLRVRPASERAVIPNAGHGSPRQNPKAFTDAVLTFIARNDAATSERH